MRVVMWDVFGESMGDMMKMAVEDMLGQLMGGGGMMEQVLREVMGR